jgi:hypothetical protein
LAWQVKETSLRLWKDKVMAVFMRTALCAALAATLSLNIAPTTVAAKSLKTAGNSETTMKRGSVAVRPMKRGSVAVRPKALTTGTQGQSAGKNKTFCGNADVFVIYEEDANGNPVPGTEEYGCTD